MRIFLFLSLFLANIRGATLDELMKASVETREKQATKGFGWMAVCRTKESTYELKRVNAGAARSIEFTQLGAGDKRALVASLTIVSNAWFLEIPGGKTIKYRPFEAAMPVALFYNLIAASELRHVDREQLEGAEIAGATNGVVEISLKTGPRVEAAMKALKSVLERVEQEPELIQRPHAKDVQAKIARLGERGLIFRVDAASGLLLEYGSPDTLQVRFSGFQWIESPVLEAKKDFADQFTPAKGIGSPNLIMASRRAVGARDHDSFVIDFQNKDYRRIPCRIGASEPGCFLPGRKSVLVHARNLVEGGSHPYLVNLETGEHTRFGPDEFHQIGSVTLGGAISPNEKQVALIHQANLGSFDRQQIRVANLSSDRVRTVGPDGVYREAIWLFSGEGLVLERLRPDADPKKPYFPEVGLLNLDGSFQAFGRGRNPAVISRDRVVFFSLEDEKWVVVNKDGQDKKTFHEKLDAMFRGPAVNPQRDFMMIVKYTRTGPESANIIQIHGGEMTALKFPPGDWANLVWGR